MSEIHAVSPRDIKKLLGIENLTLRRWVNEGLLAPVYVSPGGHVRYDRVAIEKLTKRKDARPLADRAPDAPIARGEPAVPAIHAQRVPEIDTIDPVATGDALRYQSLRVSYEIELATTAAARGTKSLKRLSDLQNAAVQKLLGISRGRLFSMLWQHHLAQVAKVLGIAPGRLREICEMYGIPTPPQGYWQTAPEHRGVRILDGWSMPLGRRSWG
jgi:hypothetical protein